MQKIIVFVAHSDDETLGMGGTIKKYSDKGDNVIVISMTNGVGSRLRNSSKVIIKDRIVLKKQVHAWSFLGQCFDFE